MFDPEQQQKIFKASIERRSIYKGIPIKLLVNFSTEIFEARREWDDIFKMLKEKKKQPCQPRILYPVKLFYRNEGGIKTFPENQKLTEFITTRPAIQEMLKGVL